MSAVLQILRDYTGGAVISPDAAFEDLKIDSLEFIEMIRDVENAYGVQIPDGDIKDIHTVRDLMDRAEGVRHSS